MVMRRDKIAGGLDLSILGLCSFVLAYGLLKGWGIFTFAPQSVIRALHETPPQTALYVLMAALIVRMILRETIPGRGDRLFLHGGMFLMACGLVLSSYVRFEGTIMLTEGQPFSGNEQEYVEGSLYKGKLAPHAPFALEAVDVTARISGNGLVADQIILKTIYGKVNSQPKDISIGSGLSWLNNGLFLRVNRFGYSPLFRFTDEAGNVIQEFFWPLKVFPPGSEDSLRSLWIPHVFYVQYYPEKESGGAMHGGPQGPLLRLRIVRNLELLFEGDVRLNELVKFESMGVTFPEVRKWAEVSVVRDNGMLLFFAGGLIAIFSIPAGYYLRRKQSKGADNRPEGQAT